MRTHNNNSKIIISLIALFICISQMLNAQSLSLQLAPSNFNGFNISCFGNQNGTIDLTVTGGTAPYTYQWSNDAQTQDLSELAAGYYHVLVTDANQATAEAEITLIEPKPIKIELSTYKYPNGFNVSQNGSCNGDVSATVSGGVSPYTYHWNPGNQTVSNPTNLCAGIVFAEVTDNNGCNLKENTILSQPEKDSWLTSGNTGSNPPTQFIGTTDSKNLVIKTNGVERVSITSQGDVHMNKLILDTIRLNRIMPLVGDSVIHIGDSSITVNLNNTITWTPANGFKGLGIGNTNNTGTTWPRPLGIGINSVAIGSGALLAYANYSIVMGNNGTLAYGANSVAIGGNIGTGTSGIHSISIGDSYPLSGTAQYFNNKPNSLGITFNSDKVTLFVAPGTGANTTGSVGIATDYIPSGFKLAVNGKIICEEVKVKLRAFWPDYVFKKNYKLMSIKDLREYINENGHLPGIPSAEEINNNDGLPVGETMTLLTKQVEELTLRLLEEDKRIEQLERELSSKK
ncbi:hypothetical protein BH11BAC1_BH11BAC1_19470 [soil metagenome]